ncbi:hypothetical protein EsH8_XIV_000042 [Colletotrichum jinshuiense]
MIRGQTSPKLSPGSSSRPQRYPRRCWLFIWRYLNFALRLVEALVVLWAGYLATLALTGFLLIYATSRLTTVVTSWPYSFLSMWPSLPNMSVPAPWTWPLTPFSFGDSSFTVIRNGSIRGTVAVGFVAAEIGRHMVNLAGLPDGGPLISRIRKRLGIASAADRDGNQASLPPSLKALATAGTLRRYSNGLNTEARRRLAVERRCIARLSVGQVVAHHIRALLNLEHVLVELWATVWRRLARLEGMLAESRRQQGQLVEAMQEWEVNDLLAGISVQYLQPKPGAIPPNNSEDDNDGDDYVFRRTLEQASHVSHLGCRVTRQVVRWWTAQLDRTRRDNEWIVEEHNAVQAMMAHVRIGRCPATAAEAEVSMRDILVAWGDLRRENCTIPQFGLLFHKPVRRVPPLGALVLDISLILGKEVACRVAFGGGRGDAGLRWKRAHESLVAWGGSI